MVTELARPESNYQSAFRELRAAKPTAAWVELVRESAMDRFELLGFPTVRNEEWKYTNLAQLAKEEFRHSIEPSGLTADDVAQFSFPETATSNLVLINGVLRNDLSKVNALDKVVAIDLFTAIGDARYNKIVRSYIARNANYNDRGLTALNTAFLHSGVFVLIPKNVQLPNIQSIDCSTITTAVILRTDDRRGRIVLGFGLAIHIRREQAVAYQIERHNIGVKEELHRAGFGV